MQTTSQHNKYTPDNSRKQLIRIVRYCAVSLALLLGDCHQPRPVLKIGLIGDQTGSYQLDSAQTSFETAAKKIVVWQPDVIVHVGDLLESIRGVTDSNAYRRQFEYMAGIIKQTKLPWLIAIGDHDVNPPQYRPLSPDSSRVVWLKQLAREFDLPYGSRFYYSFNYRGFHFIALYSLEQLHTDPRWGSIFLNTISDEQLAWLRTDLETARNSRGIFVVIHHPHWYAWSNWSKVHAILRQYPVKAVIAGHFHYDQDEGTWDGIRYVVMGATGGALKDCDPNSGGAPEYGLMTVNNHGCIDIKLHELNTDSLLELTPRVTMDRLQAVECMLDNLWTDNQLHHRDKTIQNDSQPANVNQVILRSLGNPLDLPIQVTIDYNAQILTNPRWFLDGDTLEGDKTIVLKPGERILWANYSNVSPMRLDTPIWSATINSTEHGNFQQITQSIKVTFQDERLRWIKKEIRYSIY